MTNRILNIKEDWELAKSETIRELQLGNQVILPTDTVYGIAVLSSDIEAVNGIFEIKGRSFNQALPLLVADFDQATQIVAKDSIPEGVKNFWPGPLTVVVPQHPETPIYVGSEKHTVGVRCPDHDFVRSIAAEIGSLTVTSANLSGVPTPETAPLVAEQLGKDLLVLDDGPCSGEPSTLIDLSSLNPKILRLGALKEEDLSEAGLI